MARRITISVVVLVAVLLGAVALPLGLLTSAQDRDDFRDESIAVARSVANAAEERLDDHVTRAGLTRAIDELRRDGGQVAVYDSAGRLIAGRPVVGLPSDLLARTANGAPAAEYPTADRLFVAIPVLSDLGAGRLGTVFASRSTEPLDRQVEALWAWVAAVSAAGLVASALLGTALARWVSRPLGSLEGAAQHLGDGDLTARSSADVGPPEVRKLATNFNKMAGRLQTLVSGHQAMMADVSHQLRTPLAALRLRLDVLALAAPEQLAEELAGAQDEVARLSRMVDGLLAVARAENITATLEPIPVEAVIEDRAAAWRPAAEEKSVELAVDIAEPVTARLAEGHLEQILDNLLANALEAVHAGGKIWVSAGPLDGRVAIRVADNGPGMSPQQRRAAFRRYVSATPGGTGLGLAIVDRLVTADGGTAELSETPGGGLTVAIEVPAVVRERGQRRSGTGPAAGSRPTGRAV